MKKLNLAVLIILLQLALAGIASAAVKDSSGTTPLHEGVVMTGVSATASSATPSPSAPPQTPNSAPQSTPGAGIQRVLTETLLTPTDALRIQDCATVSPDGRKFAYTVLDGIQQVVWINATPQKPFEATRCDTMVFSADSQHFAYVVTQNQKQFVIWDGKQGKPYDEILNGTPVLSADGKHLAYGAREGSKWFVVVDGQEGNSYDQLGEGFLTFSPNGQHVAYAAKSGNDYLIVADAKEYGPYQALNPPLVFSPGSKRLAFTALQNGSGFTFIDGVPGKPYDMIHSIKFSPDGALVGYSAKVGDKTLVVVNGRESQKYDMVGPIFISPDSKHFAFPAQTGEKWIMVRDGEEGAGYDQVDDPVYSPDSQKLAYPARVGTQWRMILDGTEQKLYTDVKSRSQVFSPDSRRLAYRANENDKEFIVLDGKELKLYAATGLPVFSPDSRRLAYIAQAAGASKQFVVVDEQEGAPYDVVGKILFESKVQFHYIATRAGNVYLVQEKIATPAEQAKTVNESAAVTPSVAKGPPTAKPTRLPPTAAAKLPPLVAALNRTMAVKAWRYSIQMYYSDPHQEIELFTYDGEAQGTNRRVTIGGAMTRGQKVDVIYFGDNAYYQKGGAWVFKPRSVLGNVDLESKAVFTHDPKSFTKIGDEAVDGQTCEVYTIDKEEGKRVVESQGLPEELKKNLINVEVTYWVCKDGYIHRARTRTDMLRPDGGTNIGRFESHFFDFGAPIEIAPPPDAQPAP